MASFSFKENFKPVGTCHKRAGTKAHTPGFMICKDVHPHNCIHTFKPSFCNHSFRTAWWNFFCWLEDQADFSRKVPVFLKKPCSPKKHCHVAIMSAGVHYSIVSGNVVYVPFC